MRAFRAVGVAALMVAALATLAAASEREEREPRLILPGDRSVRAGEWIELRWSGSDDVRELEILLSVDDGRSWPQCISPQLDPDRHGFRWRVPELAGGALRLRIRFNRDGREIEGPPSEPVEVASAACAPSPLGLPPLESARDDRERERGPRGPERSPGRGAGPAEDSEEEAGLAPPEPHAGRFGSDPRPPGHATAPTQAPFAAPRIVPLRT